MLRAKISRTALAFAVSLTAAEMLSAGEVQETFLSEGVTQRVGGYRPIRGEMDQEASIVKFVNLVLMQAVQDRASDIHFEPFETEFKIRYRVDGALYEMAPPPKHLALPVTSLRSLL